MEDLKVASTTHAAVEIQNSEIAQVGIGLRAKRSFAEHEEVFVVEGQQVDYRTLRTLQLDEKIHIDPVNEMGEPTLGYYLNHSCNPTAYALVHEDDKKGSTLIIYALAPITEG